MIEFLCSFILVFGWLVVRHYDVKGEMSSWQNFVKPLFVLVIYGTLVLSASISAGPSNPTLALEGGLIWTSIAYSSTTDPKNEDAATYFSEGRFGRYVWVYIVAPVSAAVAAGFLARKHMDKVKEFDKSSL